MKLSLDVWEVRKTPPGGRSVSSLRACLSIALLIGTSSLAPRGLASEFDLAGYYADAGGTTGTELRAALHAIIDDHTIVPYSASSFDTHDAIDVLDEASGDAGAVVLMYSGATAGKATWPGYNREHLWPQSLGATEGTPAHSDLHHIFACDANVNSARGNKPFGECEGTCSSHGEAPEARYDSSLWEPPDALKGDIARALLYVDVRYEGDSGEADLRLTDETPTTGCNCMGSLSNLLEWNERDPVDAQERERQEAVYLLQGNRNPFIDHPEWVCQVWTPERCLSEQVLPTHPWISELHYDNDGSDVGEGLEVAGPAGFDLSGWRIALYNGNGGGVYQWLNLSGSIPDEKLELGALWFPVDGIQNGAADGFALVDPLGEVVSFESYEGELVASGGPADGRRSTDLGVSETATGPQGLSLQRHFDPQRLDLAPLEPWGDPRPASPGRLE